MSQNSEILVILITCSEQQGPDLAKKLVQNGVAACVNQIPGIWSTYLWKGEVHRDRECLLVAKTTQNAYSDLEKLVLKDHSYDLPEILALKPAAGLEEYQRWVAQSVTEAR